MGWNNSRNITNFYCRQSVQEVAFSEVHRLGKFTKCHLHYKKAPFLGHRLKNCFQWIIRYICNLTYSLNCSTYWFNVFDRFSADGEIINTIYRDLRPPFSTPPSLRGMCELHSTPTPSLTPTLTPSPTPNPTQQLTVELNYFSVCVRACVCMCIYVCLKSGVHPQLIGGPIKH